MMDKLDKHPSWFKLKVERRELVKQLAPETAVNVLLACWDYLETGERPTGLSPIEDVALSAFLPDLEEAWQKYKRYARPCSTVRYRHVTKRQRWYPRPSVGYAHQGSRNKCSHAARREDRAADSRGRRRRGDRTGRGRRLRQNILAVERAG